MFKNLLCEDDFKLLVYELGYEIDMLEGKTNTVPISNFLNKIGFPDNWRDIVNIG